MKYLLGDFIKTNKGLIYSGKTFKVTVLDCKNETAYNFETKKFNKEYKHCLQYEFLDAHMGEDDDVLISIKER